MKRCIKILIMIIQSVANAKDSTYDTEMKSLIEKNYQDKTEASSKTMSALATIIVVVRIIGITVAILMLFVIAIKYMVAAPGEKADIKKSSTIYVVGAIILFGVTTILGIISDFAEAI